MGFYENTTSRVRVSLLIVSVKQNLTNFLYHLPQQNYFCLIIINHFPPPFFPSLLGLDSVMNLKKKKKTVLDEMPKQIKHWGRIWFWWVKKNDD